MGPLAGDRWEPTPRMKKILLTVIIVAVLLVAGWQFLRNKEGVVVVTPTPTVSSVPTVSVSPEPTASPSPDVVKNIISYSDSGYSPSIITIKKGETVTWKNESGVKMWTASAMHPTHKVYPGTSIEMCGTQTLVAIFDACAGTVSGQSWEFGFDSVGTWKYHNHLQPNHTGTIMIE